MEFEIFGHRGIPVLAAENTLSSFQMVLDYNIKGVELDVHLTRDGELVVIHDFNTKKMTGIDHEVSDTDYPTLKNLVIRDNERIPLLSEVFTLMGTTVFYDLEIKSRGKNRRELVDKLLHLIMEHGISDSCIVSSFDPFLIKEFNRLKSGIPTSVIYCNSKEEPYILRHGLGVLFTHVDIIKPHHTQLKGFLYFLFTKVMGKKCYTWTVNSREDYEMAIKRGCSGVCSDNPHLLSI